MEFLGPLAVAVFGSRRVAASLIWVALAAVGSRCWVYQPIDLDWVGLGLALLAGTLWAAYILLAGPTGQVFEVARSAVASLIGAVMLAVALTMGAPVFNAHVPGWRWRWRWCRR